MPKSQSMKTLGKNTKIICKMSAQTIITEKIDIISSDSYQILNSIDSKEQVDIYSAVYRINQNAHEIKKLLEQSSEEL